MEHLKVKKKEIWPAKQGKETEYIPGRRYDLTMKEEYWVSRLEGSRKARNAGGRCLGEEEKSRKAREKR